MNNVFEIVFFIGWACGAVTSTGVVRIVMEVRRRGR